MEEPVPRTVRIRLNAVIVAVTDEVPRILTLRNIPAPSLPYGPLDIDGDLTLELGLRRWVREQTSLELGYVEQLYTFGSLNREPAQDERILSVAYLALIREKQLPREGAAWWQDWYKLFPWEDWRAGKPELIDCSIIPQLSRWVSDAEAAEQLRRRRERVNIAFGLSGAPWNGDLVLDRYEILYEAGLVEEAHLDRQWLTGREHAGEAVPLPSRSLAFDHRRIAATALGRIRGKIQYRPVVFELLPETFTLLQLQRIVEALAGVRIHKQNFRRLVDRSGLVEGTGLREASTGGRPAELFRFRREVLLERPAPGVGLPGIRG